MLLNMPTLIKEEVTRVVWQSELCWATASAYGRPDNRRWELIVSLDRETLDFGIFDTLESAAECFSEIAPTLDEVEQLRKTAFEKLWGITEPYKAKNR